MEQERERPKRPKHRAREENQREAESELPPPPLPPRLSDFALPEPAERIDAPERAEEAVEEVPAEPKPAEQTPVVLRAPSVPKSEEQKPESPTSLQPKANGEKAQEARLSQHSSSGLVRELPFDALMPRTAAQELPVGPQVAPIYPTIAQEAASSAPPAYQEVAAALPQARVRQQPVPALYPPLTTLQSATAPVEQEFLSTFGERELMNEAQLLEFYQNDLLDTVDDFVDEFVTKEIKPNNSLHDLLANFKAACDQIEQNRGIKTKASARLIEVNNSVWAVTDHEVSRSGQCGEGKHASGKATYKKAKFVPERLNELKQQLAHLTKVELDEGFCAEIRARSLALQIQWIVVSLGQQFMTTQQLTVQSVPILIPGERNEHYRTELIGALSDLFFHLRFPILPDRFRESVCNWIVELSAVLLKAITFNDQAFLLAQILRCHKPLEWAIPLVQTFINVPSLDPTVAINSFMALLKTLLEPIRRREDFLGRIKTFYEGDNEWDLVDDEGNADNQKITDMDELDLIAILNQFDFRALYSVAIQKFTAVYQADKRRIFLSLLGFTLMLLRIQNEGLKTYGALKNVGKKISDGIRKAVQTICTYWRLMLKEGGVAGAQQLQNEVNRLVLQALYYVVSKPSVGLWQFAVDFPFFALTDFARIRCLILLRNPHKYTIPKLYEIEDANLLNVLEPKKDTSGQLLNDLENVGVADRNYAITLFGQLVGDFQTVDCQHFTTDLIDVCFIAKETRELYSKVSGSGLFSRSIVGFPVGSEVVSHILEKKPQMLAAIVRYVQWRIDNAGDYAVDILSKASLLKGSLTAADVGDILGKFLVAREVTNQGSRFARGVLSGLDWGAEDDLFLPQDVHARCAMEVVNAHKAHCKTRNSSIGKSITKSAKLLLKVSDPEQEFDRWCWSILIRLKIVPKPLANPPENDLTAFFVYLQEKCLSSPEMFVESGLNYWVELVNASCFYGAGVVLLKLLEKFPARVHLFTANEKFKAALDALFAADGTSYVHQFFNPNDRFPGPILRLLSSGLSHQFDKQANQTQLKPLLNGWMQLLTCKRPTPWTADKSSLHLIGVVGRAAFLHDPLTCTGLIDILLSSYQAILNAWKDAPKGVFSWFATPSPPRLIESADIPHAPWASYLMLRAETEAPAHAKFFESLHANLAKHPKRELDEAVKRTATKVQWNIGVSQLPYFRWLEMCTQKAVRNDPFVFPLALQQLATSMLSRVKVSGKDVCFGDRYFASPSSKHLFDELAKALAEAEKETNSGPLGSFFRATSVWIHTPSIYAPNFNNFHDVPMDFLLQRIFTGDRHPWVELLDMKGLRERVVAEANVFAGFCHLVHPAPPTSSGAAHPQTISELFQHLQLTPADLKFFPVVPLHQNLPASGLLTFDDAQNAQVVSGRLNTAVEELVKIAKRVHTLEAFLESKDKIEVLNDEYGQKFRHLYTIQQTTLSVKMQCGSAFLAANCRRPGIQTVVVDDASRYDSEVAMAMNENRMKRENLITELLQTLDNTAIISARMEFICWMLNAYSRQQAAFEPPPVYSAKGMEMMRDPVLNPVQNSGRSLFYRLCEHSNRPEILLFPALTNGIQCCLHHLGVAFIAEHPTEQMNLLRIVISGHPLDVSEFFTPHSVSADELHKLYTELSSGIRNASTKEASMALLKRLDIQHAGQKLPPNQFSSLLPVIFENLASVPMDTPLHSLCGTHFEHAMFHAFPHNFVSGLRLLLSGCDSHCVPLSLFHSVVRHFSMDEFFANANKAISATKCTISVELAGESVRVIAEQLKKSRHELSTRLFAIWVDYLGLVLKIADFFVRSIVCQQFNSTLLPSVIEADLCNVFLLVLTVWGPLLEPVGPSALAPWNPADQELANGVVGRFVELLAWLPHSTFLPPSSECVEKLFFEYFARTLASLQRSGSSHIYPVFESKCVALNWTRFLPNLPDMADFERVLVDGQPEAAPFLVDVIVRVNWREVVVHMNGQPTEAHRAFYSLLLTVLSRIVARTSNYAKSRASVEKLLRDFHSLGHWQFVKAEVVEKIAHFIAGSFPTDFLANTNDVLNAFSSLWRESCCFTTTPRSIGLPADSADMKVDVIAAKQAMFVHSHVHLLLRSKLSIEDQCRQYKELLDKCYLQIGAAFSGKSEQQGETELQKFAPIARELIAFWPQISKDKHLDAFFHTMTTWLNDHPESVLLLLVMHVVMSALGKSAPQLGLKLLDKSVMTYFKRKLSCDWQEICRWIRIPENMKEWLYTTPSSDAGIEPRFLTLNAHLLNEMSRLSSAPEEERVMRRLGEYLQSIKPKHIQSEVSFVCVLEKYQRMVVRQYANGVPVGIANEQMEVFISFLRKIFSEDKGVSLFNVRAMFSKKAAFPIRLQLLAHIISLYLTQQQTSLSQPPRQTAGQPVLCSRISAFRELQTERRYQEVENSSTIFQFALPYFNQPESHTLQHVSTLFFRIADLLYPDSSKLLRHLDGTV